MYPFKTDPDKEITLVRKNIGRLKTNRAASLAMVQRHQAAAAAANTAGDDKAGVERNLQAKRSAEENVATDDI